MTLEPFNPFLPEFYVNPYPFYQRYRVEEPVHLGLSSVAGRDKAWYFFRYNDSAQALSGPYFGREEGSETTPQNVPRKNRLFTEMSRQWMAFKNPPYHSRLRTLVNKAFTPRLVRELKPRIENITNHLLDQVQASGHMDLVADFAFPLPVTVIAEMLGIPPKDQPQFRRWSQDFAAALDIRQTQNPLIRASQSTAEASEYLKEIIAIRSQDPQDDLISGLIAAEEEGGKLSRDELVAMCILLLFAGHETTGNLIGNGIYALLCHPEQLALLKESPDLIDGAVEELLRYDTTLQMLGRVTLEDVEIEGNFIAKGEFVNLVIGSGNRDPEVYPNPDVLDITRPPKIHLSFGRGIHFCLGAPLARLEAQVAINTILARMPNLRLQSETVEWRKSVVFRGLKALPLLF